MAFVKKKKSKKGLIFGILLVVIVLLIISATLLAPKNNYYSTTEAVKGNIETYYTFSGVVESKNSQNVMAGSVMQISEIKVNEGDLVEKDDVLFKTSQGTEIKAEVAGTISKIYVKEDQQIMAGSQLCDIYDYNNLQVTIKVDEYDLSSISEGKEVSVNIGSLDLNVVGTVSSISDTATNQQGVAYFTAVIDLPQGQDIKIGMTAEAKILNKQALNVLTVPMEALQFDDEDNTYVLIPGEKNTTNNQIVTVGINDGISVEITEGLSEGQTIYYTKILSSDTSSNSMMPPNPNNTTGGE